MSVLTAVRSASSRETSADVLGSEDYHPPAHPAPRTLADRLAPLWSQVRTSRSCAALAVVDGVAVIAMLLSLRTVPVQGSDAAGLFAARCGLDSYVLGQGTPVVTDLCRAAYTEHAQIMLLSSSIALVATVALLVMQREDPSSGRVVSALRRLVNRVVATPVRAAFLTLSGLMAGVAGVAVWPVSVQLQDQAGPVTAQCGVGYALSGHPNEVVERACQQAYGGRTALLIVCLVLAVAALALALTVTTPQSPSTEVIPERVTDDSD